MRTETRRIRCRAAYRSAQPRGSWSYRRASFDDTTDEDYVVNPGIFALISRATCVDLDGTQRRVSVWPTRRVAGSANMLKAARAVGPVMQLAPTTPDRGADRTGDLSTRPVGIG